MNVENEKDVSKEDVYSIYFSYSKEGIVRKSSKQYLVIPGKGVGSIAVHIRMHHVATVDIR